MNGVLLLALVAMLAQQTLVTLGKTIVPVIGPAVVFGGAFWKRQIAFRDALRGNEQLAQQYWKLKQRLAARFPNDRAAYTDGKGEFIRSVLAGA